MKMNKKILSAAAAGALLLTSCGTMGSALGSAALGAMLGGNDTAQAGSTAASAGSSILGSVISSATNGNTLGNIFSSIIGLDKLDAHALVGTWHYSQPGCAFTSQSTLAAAGGEVVAGTVKEKLTEYYKKVGFKSSNTGFIFNSDGTYTATLLGKNISGTYTFDPSTQGITLNVSILGVSAYSLPGFVKKNTNGIALLFESKKILGILQTLGAMSGNSTVSSITQLTNNYDGVRVGFDLVK